MKTWPTKKITDICDLERGTEPGSAFYIEASDKSIPFLRVGDLTGKVDAPKFVKNDNSNLRIVNGNETLITFDGTPGIVVRGFKGAIASGIRVVRNIKSEIDEIFLFYYLQTQNVQKTIKAYSKGATIIHASTSIPYIKIPFPPLNIQEQIVERLDKIAEARKLNDELIQKSEELFQSLLHKELNSAGKDWGVKNLGEVFERITESVLPTKQPDQEFNFIGLENIESNTGQIVGLNPTKGKLIKSTKTLFRKNDVLYGKLRPYLNKVWIADTNGICSTDIWVLRAKQDVISPLLLSSILRQQRIVMKSSASMAGANLPRVNKNVFDSIKIQIPPLEAQKRIVAKLSAAQEYKNQLLAQKSKLKELFESVLNKSMKGKS